MSKSENSQYSPNAEAYLTYANLYVASYRHPYREIGEKTTCHSAISVTPAIQDSLYTEARYTYANLYVT